jgi:type II secretory pathway pseudopilin PulG
MRKAGRRGFSLLTVFVVTALVSVSSIVVLNLVTDDQNNVRYTRERLHAREVAEGALMEVANDTETAESLPGVDSDEISIAYEPSSNSAFVGEGDAHRPPERYEATISHVRFVPVLESSITRITAVVYEVETNAVVNDGAGSQQIEAEVYRVVGLPMGKVLPRVHAR